MQYIYTMEYYSVIKKNKIMPKIMPSAATWMQLEIITLSEVSQTKTNIYDVTFMWNQYCCCSVAKSCPTLCSSMDCSMPGSSVHETSPGKNSGVGSHSLFQGIFLTQGSNPCLLHSGIFFTVWATREAKWTYLWNINRLTNIENKLIVTKGKG